MSRPFESFEFLNRGWDVRLLENQSLRSLFVAVLVYSFMIGMMTTITGYEIVRHHRFYPNTAIMLPVFIVLGFRYSRLIYRRLGR